MRTAIFLTLILLSLTSCQINGKKNTTLHIEEEKLVDYLFEGATGDNPGANLLVVKNGIIVDQRSYGLANVEQRIKSMPETNYRIASVSKSFTAMAIMILEHQGKVSYETRLTEIFPDFPKYGNTINVRHLLTHQSGVIDYDEFFEEESTVQMLDSDVMEGLKQVDSTYFLSGTQYRYSNSGYALLALIVEKLSDQSFADFMNEEIFDKLKMTNTQVFELDRTILNRAYGYSINNDSIIFNDQSVTSAIQGDGGVYSNVMDYLKWDQALYTDTLIPLEKLEAAFYDYDNYEKTVNEGYGYGWSINYHNGIKIISHSGGTAGFGTFVTRIPSLKMSVIIFTNRDGHDRHLMHRMNALVSMYSDYQIPMPVEIMMKKEIDQRGVNYGVEIYDTLENNKNYEYTATTPSYLGFEYFRLKKFKIAEVLFVKDTIEHPDHFGGYYGLGRVYQRLNEVDKAILNFRKVIELAPDSQNRILNYSKKALIDLEN